MKHKELVFLAKQWLIQAKGCNPVFTEKGSAKNNEFPDAIGWNSEGSIVVECKTCLTDFEADKLKDCRWQGKGLGRYRYFLVERVLYDVIKGFPHHWGILVVDNDYSLPRQERFKGSSVFESNIEAERNFLRSRILEIQRFGR